jgi:ketosteroid isomerase-like protein
MRGGPVSQEVADRFVEALRKLEEDRDVEALVEVHTDDCDVGNVAVPKTFSGHEGLREFWTSYRDTFGEMKSEFRNVFADDAGHAALEWNTSGDANGKDVSYDGVSLLEIQEDKVSRFRAYFDPRTINEQVVG